MVACLGIAGVLIDYVARAPFSVDASFEQIYDDHVWRVYGFFAYRLESRLDAEDLTQQTFERALAAWRRFDPRRAAPGTWLIAIARNLLIDHLRRASSAQQRSLHADDSRGVVYIDPDLGLEPDLAAALGALGEREREVIALRFGADLSGREIADQLGISVANAQQILSRSLRRLRRLLEESQAAKGPIPATPSAAASSSSSPQPE
jgi:RNA polymerase sigma factor (sigma-70 family)